jgi:predicted membrane channel-forming protein YqfA (hemolysin III family)
MKKHTLWMIIGCGLPLLLIFFAPALGLGNDISLFIFVIAMFACHLLMPMHHGNHNHNKHKKHSQTTKTENHESH